MQKRNQIVSSDKLISVQLIAEIVNTFTLVHSLVSQWCPSGVINHYLSTHSNSKFNIFTFLLPNQFIKGNQIKIRYMLQHAFGKSKPLIDNNYGTNKALQCRVQLARPASQISQIPSNINNWNKEPHNQSKSNSLYLGENLSLYDIT